MPSHSSKRCVQATTSWRWGRGRESRSAPRGRRRGRPRRLRRGPRSRPREPARAGSPPAATRDRRSRRRAAAIAPLSSPAAMARPSAPIEPPWRCGLQLRDCRREPPTAGADDVTEHRTGLHGGELARVADEDQAGVRADRLGQPRHLRQRHHRGLVHDHDVVRQPLAAVVAEAAAAVGPPAEQAVQGGAAQPEDLLADLRGDVEVPPPRR